MVYGDTPSALSTISRGLDKYHSRDHKWCVYPLRNPLLQSGLQPMPSPGNATAVEQLASFGPLTASLHE
jgi:hypothetical protein